MMRRVVFILLASTAAIALAWWVGRLPGTVSVSGFGYVAEAATPVAVVAGTLALLVLLLVLRLLLALLGVPVAIGFWRSARRRRGGDAAAGRALVALAAGEASAALRASRKARTALGDTPQTLLLAAEAARLAGDLAGAEACHQALAADPEGAFLGLRGLFRLAVEREDWAEASSLARRAEALHPGGAWLRDARLRLAEATGAWSQAMALAGPDLPADLIATAAAIAEADPIAAARLARQAWKADPDFPPAVIAHAAALRREGHDSRAEEVVVAAWREAPHPDLAEFLMEDMPDPRARLGVAVTLSNAYAEHVETQYLLGRLSLAAGDLYEAQHHAERALALAVPTRRIHLLLADLATANLNTSGRGDPTKMLRAAAEAPSDPSWRCGQCGAAHRRWHLMCPSCHGAGRITWDAPKPPRRPLLSAPAS